MDITLCSGGNCPKKGKCYRYLAKPSVMQSYMEVPYKKGKCEYFWETITRTHSERNKT